MKCKTTPGRDAKERVNNLIRLGYIELNFVNEITLPISFSVETPFTLDESEITYIRSIHKQDYEKLRINNTRNLANI